MNLEIQQILSQIIAFLFTLWVLKKFAWRPLLGILDERKERIKSEFESIDEQKKVLQSQIEDYNLKLKNIENTARNKFDAVINEAKKSANLITKEAHENAKAILNKASTSIEQEVAKAKEELKKDTVLMAINLTEKIIQGTLDEDTHKKLLAEFADKVEPK